LNNLKYYNDSLAYDFDMFAPKERQASRDNIVVMPNCGTKASRKAARRLSPTVAAIMCVVFLLAGLCGNIALRIKINEVNSEINDYKSQIIELDSERTALEVEFQRKISYVNLELEAMSLGMKKPSKDDITYIRVNDTDMAKNADGEVLE
jgi:outer membrane murein-binding lipoprotein Lpp